MSEAADPWSPGRDEDARPGPPTVEPGKSPDVMKVFTDALNDMVAHFADYLLAGLGLFVPLMVITTTLVTIAVVVGFLPMLLGAALDEPEIGSLAGVLAMLVAVFAAAMLATALTAPLQASLARALVAHQLEGEKLGFGSAYSRVTDDLGAVLGLTFAQVGLALVGAMMCYFPALVVGWALSFALPALVVHRLGVVGSIRRSAQHAFAQPGWHLGFFALGFVILFVGQNVPLIGPILSLPFWLAYNLRGYLGFFPR